MKLTKNDIDLLISHDRKAQAKLYEGCYGYMMSICLRYQPDRQMANQVLNQAFLKVLKNIHAFNVDKNLMPWLAKITVNTNIDARRKSQNLRTLISSENMQDFGYQNISKQNYNEADLLFDAEQLLEMVKKLPDTTGKVFNMYVIDGFKHQEIGEMLGISSGTSKWHLNNARKKLKEMILDINEFEKVIHYGE